jgi:hypothetical protein
MRRRHLPLLVVLLVAPTGCLTWEEKMCSEGEVPVYHVDNASGRDCVTEGTEPDDGYALFPPDRVPEEPGDRYDRWPLAKDYPWADEVSDDVRREARRARR